MQHNLGIYANTSKIRWLNTLQYFRYGTHRRLRTLKRKQSTSPEENMSK